MKNYSVKTYNTDLIESYLNNIVQTFDDPETLEDSRRSEKDFTRKRLLSFRDLLNIGLRNSKATNAKVANEYLQNYTDKENIVSRQAYSKARHKFNHLPYLYGFKEGVRTYLENVQELKTFNGLIPVAIDGMQLPLPRDPELIEVFGTAGRGDTAATARTSCAYLIFEEIILDAQIGAFCEDERQMLLIHLEEIAKLLDPEKVLIILDRGYPSKEVIDKLEEYGFKYLMRTRSNFTLMTQRAPEGLTHIETFKGQVYELYKFRLPSGNLEMLITNTDFNEDTLEKGYSIRWDIETENNVLKNKLTLTDFSGFKTNAIIQDFFAALIIANLVNIISNSVQDEIELAREGSDNIHPYKANKNEIIGCLCSNILSILTTEEEEKIKKRIRYIYDFACKNVIPVIKGRQFPRSFKPSLNKRKKQKRNT